MARSVSLTLPPNGFGKGRFGRRAKEAVPALKIALKDSDHQVRDLAALTLRKIK
jgi:hypothetical protein